MKHIYAILAILVIGVAIREKTLADKMQSIDVCLTDIDERITSIEQELELPLPSAPKADSVRITYYEPVIEQCQGNPLITANGSKIDTIALRNGEIRWVAVSRDLELKYPMGSEIDIYIREGHPWNGTYQVMDRTSSRLSKTVDILSNTFKGGCYKGVII